ncbi:hypothetical protein NKY68_24460 [Sinorhizobium meliloti]|uniref:hypothetical protein n=1 Tax=Rhizobium meliloti TaxID=382 RepID=UPI003D64A743
MTDLARITLLAFTILAVIFGLGVAASLAGAFAGFIIVLAAPVLVIALLAGTAIFMWRGIRRARESTRLAAARVVDIVAAPGVAVIVLALSAPIFSVGSLSRAWISLANNRAHYQEIVASLQAGGRDPADGQPQVERGITFISDVGPPLRVAFNPEGILDNWSAIVFDPTQVVMRADGFDPISSTFAAPDSITKLFGGDLVRCRRLSDSYFFCSFT